MTFQKDRKDDIFPSILCLSFQICHETECQLLSSNQFQSKLDALIGCTYYDMTPPASKQV